VEKSKYNFTFLGNLPNYLGGFLFDYHLIRRVLQYPLGNYWNLHVYNVPQFAIAPQNVLESVVVSGTFVI